MSRLKTLLNFGKLRKIKFLRFHFLFLFLYPPMKIFIFQTDPESFHFCFRSLSTTCQPLVQFSRLPVNSFSSFLLLIVRACSLVRTLHFDTNLLFVFHCFLVVLRLVPLYFVVTNHFQTGHPSSRCFHALPTAFFVSYPCLGL